MVQQKIFFSYARNDASEFALKLANDLRNAGANVWIDQLDIRGGQDYNNVIEKALADSTCILFIVSERSIISKYVLTEVYYGIDENKLVIPILLFDTKLPFRLRGLQNINFINDYKKGFEHLLGALNINATNIIITNSYSNNESKAVKVKASDDTAQKKETGGLYATFKKKLFPYPTFLLIGITLLIIVVIWIAINGRISQHSETSVANTSTDTTSSSTIEMRYSDSAYTNIAKADSLFNLGKHLYNQNSFASAIDMFSSVLLLNPNHEGACLYRGMAKDEFKDYKGAIEDYDRAIKLNPLNELIYYNRGISKNSLKDYKGAIEDYDRAIELNPLKDYVFTNRGVAKEGISDYKGAITDYSQAIILNPKSANAFYNRAKIELTFKEFDLACLDFKKNCELGDEDGCSEYKKLCNNNQAEK